MILNISDDQKIQYLSQNIDSGKSKDKNNEKNLYYAIAWIKGERISP